MPTASLIRAPAIAAALCLLASPAHGVQLAISEPADVVRFESRFALIPITFELVNTGVPDLKSLEFVAINEVVTPWDAKSDITREVLKTSEVGPCKFKGVVLTRLAPAESCKVVATFLSLDADPFDQHKVVDQAVWLAGLSVDWRFVGETAVHNEANGALVTLKDDPVPEPSAWALLLAGFTALGAALRRRRGVVR